MTVTDAGIVSMLVANDWDLCAELDVIITTSTSTAEAADRLEAVLDDAFPLDDGQRWSDAGLVQFVTDAAGGEIS